MNNNIITAVSKANIPHELTKDKKYKIYCERYDIETKVEEILIICNMGFEKWYKSELFVINN